MHGQYNRESVANGACTEGTQKPKKVGNGIEDSVDTKSDVPCIRLATSGVSSLCPCLVRSKEGKMTAPQTPRKREYIPHQQHGHHILKKALSTASHQHDWLEDLGEVGASLKAWQTDIIHDLGGADNISAMQRSIVELATKTHLLLASVDKYLLAQDSLVNKRRRQLFPIVGQRQQLADALARYMSTLGLEKRSKTVATIGEYIEEKAS